MKAVKAQLEQYTPASSRGIPVTEFVIFKLLPDFASQDSDTLLNRIRDDFAKPSASGDGIRLVSYGRGVDDASSVILGFDWRRIEDHWDFWLTPAFEPVSNTIQTLFEPGMPLVKHYKFDQPGMLRDAVQRVVVWKAGAGKENPSNDVNAKGGSGSVKRGWAVDAGEADWYIVTVGYADESKAVNDQATVPDGATNIVFKMNFIEGEKKDTFE